MTSSPFEKLRERKLIQWVFAYLAGAWLLLQVVSVLAQPFHLPDVVVRATAIVLGVGVVAVTVIAWYHGERGAQRVTGPELVMVGALLFVAALGVTLTARDGSSLVARGVPTTALAATPPDGRPLVLMMDSPHPARVYDRETLAANGTNADVISDILLDLPIHRQKEAIGPSWHREEEIREFHPALIMVHWSGFCQDACTDRTRLLQLVNYFAQDTTRFLIYSRAPEDSLRFRVDSLLAPVEKLHPGIADRINAFGVTDHGPPYWRDPVTASELKMRVREVLRLP